MSRSLGKSQGRGFHTLGDTLGGSVYFAVGCVHDQRHHCSAGDSGVVLAYVITYMKAAFGSYFHIAYPRLDVKGVGHCFTGHDHPQGNAIFIEEFHLGNYHIGAVDE